MKKNRILVVLVLIGILASFILTIKRVKIEDENKVVDITLDYNEMVKLSEQSEEDLTWWFEKFREWGVRTVTLNEETLESLIEESRPIEITLVGNVLKDINWKEKYPMELVSYIEKNEVDKYDLIGITNSEDVYKFVAKGLRDRYSEDKYKIIEAEKYFIFLLDGTEKDTLYSKEVFVDDNNKPFLQRNSLESSKLIRLGLGFDEEKIKLIKDSGLEVILRPYNFNPSWIEEKYIQATLREYEDYNIQPKYMIFTGEQILGYPQDLDLLRNFMIDNDMKVGLIETGVQRGHLEQEGIEGLVGALDYNTVRLFSMAPYIQERFKFYNYNGAEEIENTLYRAVTERNIRLIYFRPFKQDKNTYVTDYEEYEKTFNSFKERIAKHKMVLGEASTMKPNYISLGLKILIGLGAFGGGMILLGFIFKISNKLYNIMTILGIPAVAIVTYIVPNLSVKLYSVAAAIIFPSLSMVYLVSKMKSYYFSKENKATIRNAITLGIKTLIIMVLISSIGVLFVASILSSTDYLLEMDVFRGVKFAQLIPILIYLIVFLGYFGYKEDNVKDSKIRISDVKEILSTNIKIISVIVVGIALFIGYIYIARTGHETNVQPSNLEMIGRNFLELKLIARPRIKEFIVAFPAVILVAYMMLNRRKLEMFILGIAIVIGQTSIVNTFSHLRTPMYLSTIRTIYGVLFGIVLGIIYLIVLNLVLKLGKTLRGELFNE